tara:strand:- start:5659 stop:5979 length:321 start_codon:yes stop_codon:yes gene_type:complete
MLLLILCCGYCGTFNKREFVMADVKESVELIEGLGALSKAVVAELKDGFQPVGDVLAVIKAALDKNSELNAKLLAAFVGIAAVPGELGDLDLFEIIKLGQEIIEEV